MKYLKNMTVQILVACVLGILFGLLVGPWASNLKFIGDMFIRLIQMSMVPLVMSSVIVATGSMSGKGAGRLAGLTFGWILGLSAVSALVAWGLSSLIRPGAGMAFTGTLDPSLAKSATETTGWQDTILNFVSKNVVDAMAQGNMVPIIVFSLLFGAALNAYVTKTGRTEVLHFMEQLQQIVLTMIRFVMVVAPIGIFCLLADLAGEVGFGVVTTALKYLGTTLLGVIILMVAFSLFTAAVTGIKLSALPGKLTEQTVVAVTTTSSAVTFPTVLRTAVEKLGVSQRVANFTLSIGLTMGSYGAVLNYTIVVMFLAQAGNVHLTAGQLILGMVLAILLNMGTITVPGGFPVVAMFLASAIGLPFQAIGLLIAVDWFTGMFRTFLNVNGDSLVALLVANHSKEIDMDVYNGVRTVSSEEIDPEEYEKQFQAADAAD
ncbi:MAG: dicarboxylate/amino acid:cation symporter [Acidipropionibacterium sp.]|jgi:Na+/H+-dicarboxylate symporter|nr:dicarboxylate/amino acid:cation symporter [Acidipropionibacterium sp.]